MTTATHEERPVWIELNGVRCIVLSCSPHDTEALAVGHLLSEGWVASPAAVRSVHTQSGPGESVGVRVEADAARFDVTQRLHAHQILHGCGSRHFLDCDRSTLRAVSAPTDHIDAVALLRALFAAAERGTPDGGLHAVAVSDGSMLVHVAFDVARHCAVDRAIGTAAQQDHDLTQLGFVSTARISGAMVLKAVRSGIGWIAGRSIATSLARELADAYGLALFERAGKVRR